MTANELSETPRELAAMRVRALAMGTQAVGALAIGAVAIGVLEGGVFVFGLLLFGGDKNTRLEIDDLVVGRLRVTDSIEVPDSRRRASRAKPAGR
jgi:hypothetical protein